MAKQLSKAGITDGALATAAQVTQSIDSLTGVDAYDLTLSGSLTITGSLLVSGSTDIDGNLAIPGYPDVAGSLGLVTTGTIPYTGSAEISGSLNVMGEIGHITASGNISASGDVIGLDLIGVSGSFTDLSVSNRAELGNSTTDINILRGDSQFRIQEDHGGKVSIYEEAIAKEIFTAVVSSVPIAYFAFDPTLFDNDSEGQARMGLGVPTESIDAKLHIRQKDGSGEPNNLLRIDLDSNPSFRIANDLNIFASGSMAVQGGKPITTHTTNLTASLPEAGHYHIVGGLHTCSVQTGLSVPIGAEFEFFQTSSTGNFLFEAGAGVTLISKDSNKNLTGLGSAATLKKVASSTFHLIGDLTS